MLAPALATAAYSARQSAAVMPIRLRKLIGTVLLLALVIIWALLAMALAQAPFIHDHAIAAVVYYIVAGLGWVLPAMPLVAWMSRDQRTENR